MLHYTRLVRLVSDKHTTIVCRFPNETTCVSLQKFIVRFLIISNMKDRHIYTQTERRGNGLAAGETERECVSSREWLKIELSSVVKMAVGERLTISG